MERYLAKLADLARRRRRLVVAVWAALLRLSSGGWDVPGSQSATRATLLKRFPGRDGVELAVLVEGSSPGRTDAALERTRAAVSSFSDVRRPSTGGQPTRRRRIASRSGTEAVVGGMTASVVDTSDAVTGSLRKILLFVLAASYLILLVCCGACSCRSRRC